VQIVGMGGKGTEPRDHLSVKECGMTKAAYDGGKTNGVYLISRTTKED